ncbi:MAG: hypothetical protein LBN00_00610 [Oscillospiraceae bacterium]|jgi:hypothetical protein|nr:hypothetical protein [Oscillospiraceae bacterium]
MKKIIAGILLVISLLTLTSCGNKKIFDTTYTFNYAMIKMPDGSILEGRLESWTDYEGEQLQVTIDGNTYLVSSINTVLMVKKP